MSNQSEVKISVSLQFPGIIDISGDATVRFSQRLILEEIVSKICDSAPDYDSIGLKEWEDVFLRMAAMCREAGDTPLRRF